MQEEGEDQQFAGAGAFAGCLGDTQQGVQLRVVGRELAGKVPEPLGLFAKRRGKLELLLLVLVGIANTGG